MNYQMFVRDTFSMAKNAELPFLLLDCLTTEIMSSLDPFLLLSAFENVYSLF